MEHVDSFAGLGDVEHSVFKLGVDRNFVDSRTHTRHWLPIRWLQTFLNKMQTVSGHATSVFRKGMDILKRGSDPEDGFFIHEESIQIFVYDVNVA